MSETKPWTAGPWKVGTKHPCRILSASTELKRGNLVATTCQSDDEGTETDQEKADARLIAAAPSLFEALENILWLVETEHDYDCPQAVSARAALVAARGETP